MGVFSKHHRFREAGEGVNVYNVEDYGTPERSLFTSTKVFTLHHHIDITDENGNVVYESRSKVISLHDKTDVYKATGEKVAHIERKIFTLHERHYVTMANGLNFELSNEIFHLIKDITNLEGLGWTLKGNIFGLNFRLFDSDGSIIAVIGQKMFSLHDKYCIDIYKKEHEEIVIAILVALQHMNCDRGTTAAGGGASGGSGG